MKQYLIPFLAYVFTVPVLEYLGVDHYISYAIRTLLAFFLLILFWRDYKLRFVSSSFAILMGVIIALFWVVLDNFYAYDYQFIPPNSGILAIKLLSFLFLAPFIEELFVRDFLNRIIINKDWQKVKIGTFSPLSFVFTVIIFGLSHTQWISGLVAGVLFNLVLMKTRRIESAIESHIVANFFVMFFVFLTGNFGLW